MNWQKVALWVVGLTALTAVIIVALLRDKIVNNPQWQISATGRGEVSYIPNEATITLGYNVERANDAASALRTLNEKIAAIIKALEDQGVARDKILTQAYSLSQRYDYINGESKPNGYQANQQLVITISGIDTNPNRASEVIEVASKAGANQVLGVSFGIEDIDALKEQARAEAITEARARAVTMEQQLGIELGDIVGMWENPIYVPEPSMYGGGYGAGAGGGGMPVVPQGTNELILEVSINYELEK